MKSAEEWTKELSAFRAKTHCLDMPFQTKEMIKQIQLDAWKQGMSDAEEIVYDSHDTREARNAIVTAKHRKEL